MTTMLMKTPIDPALIERVLIHGDLRQLTPAQKVSDYNAVCESVGLNPLTQPFQYIVLNGKEVLYARRDATDQLRQIHTVSIKIVAREVTEGIYVVTAQAALPSGRQDESIGAVPIATVKGEALANAMMKAETKAKRRVTLAICGLGMLDETEVQSIDTAKGYAVEAPREAVVGHGQSLLGPSDPNGGDSGALLTPPPDGYEDWWFQAMAAAEKGQRALATVWETAPKGCRKFTYTSNQKGWEGLKARATAVDTKTPAGVA